MSWTLLNALRRGQAKQRKPLRKVFNPQLEKLEAREVPATDVLMYHNDIASTGQNLTETILTPGNVNTTTFGKLYSTPLDGQVYAQTLYKTAVNITTGPDQGVKDIAIVATEHNTVYAINTLNGAVLWSRNLGPSVPQSDVLTGDITNEIGITGTGVIDASRNIFFVIAKTKENGNHYVQRLWALNLSDGSNALGGPAVIADTTYNGSYTYNSGPYTIGNGDGAINVGGQNRVYFNALRENDRSNATLVGNNLYLAFASHGDNGPYHGWVLYYDVSGSSMTLKGALNTTPNGGLGGIWEAGGGITVDPQGFLYVETGNGSFDKTLDANGFPINGNYGNAFIKIGLDATTTQGNQGTNKNGWGLKVVDYFVPFNVDNLNAGDVDLGSGGPLILPDSFGSAAHPHLLIGGGKEGKLYLIDRDNMGKFSTTSDNVVQVVTNAANGILSTPTLYKNTIYVFSGYGNDTGRAFTISNGAVNTTTTSRTTDGFGYVGWTASVSANGANNGIVWVLDRGANELRAYDAANLGTKLYTSNQAGGSRDTLGAVQKFSVPTVADGHVFVGTSNSFVAYGLLAPPTSRPAQPTNLIATAASSRQVNLTWTDNSNILANQEDTTTIERSANGGATWTVLGTVGRNITSYIDLTVSATTQYSYRVKSTNTLGDSPYSPTATVTTPAPSADGDGLLATYFDNQNFTGTSVSRIDPTINFDWGNGSPDPQIGPDTFSARWTGQIKAAYSETFTFTTTSDDGIRLKINGVTVIDSFIDQGPTEHSGTFAMTAGQRYDIVLEYYENGGGAVAKLEWQSASQPRQFIPTAALFSTAVQAPNAPSNLTGTAVSGTQINLSWTDNSTNESGFKVERASDSNFTQNLATFQVSANTTSFQDTNGVTNGITYWYRVRASSVNGDSNASNAISVLTPTPPVTPSGGHTTLVTTTRIDFAWNDNANNETTYEILRRTGSGGTYEHLATLPANTTSYSDTGLTPGTLYNYHILAVNAAGNADFTGVNTQTKPVAPGSVTATGGNGLVSLAWTGSFGADNYNIYRGTSPGTETLLLSNSGGTTYTDINVSGGVTYYYKVTAFNMGGESAQSNEVAATPSGNTAPVVTTNPFANPSPSTGTTTTLSVRATDDGGEANLTYTWTNHIGGKPVGAPDPTFSAANGTNAGKDTVVTFYQAGSYSFDLVIDDGSLDTEVEAAVIVTVSQNYTSVSISPANVSIGTGATQQFTATALDQFGQALTAQPTFTWDLASGIGSISASGLYTAPASAGSAVVRATATVGGTPRNATTNVTVGSGALNFPNFASTAGLTLNGNAVAVANALQITANAGNQDGSAFSTNKVGVSQFTTNFSFQTTAGNTADGFTFTIQGLANTALGPTGGGLGFGPDSTAGAAGIPTSVAVKFDLYDNQGEGVNSTGLYLNGSAPTNVGSVNLTGTGIDLHSGHVFNVGMTYDGTTLRVTITDATTGASATQNYAVNIPQVVGGSTAYVGFTGATGGVTAQQSILSWTYTPGAAPQPPAAPTGLTATAGNAQVTLNWAAVSGATSYNVYRGTTAGGESATALGTVTSTSYTDSTVTNGTTYFYIVKAVNGVGASAASNEASATPQIPAPAAPTALTATAGNAQIALSWTASATATSYKVYRGTSANGESATAIATVTTASFTDTGLTNGTTYFYKVSAVNAGGESTGLSNEASGTPIAVGAGNGLFATYFDNIDLTGPTVTRTDATINFDWGTGSPSPTIGVDTFSARWTGQIQPKYSEAYTFYTTSDDGIRLWVNGQLVINQWNDHAPTVHSGTIALTAGQKYDIVMEFYENGGGAVAKLEWQSTSQAREFVPQSQLYSTAPAVPAAPSGLAATAVSSSQINLAWIDNSNNETGFKVERSTDGTNYTLVTTVGAGVTSYSNTGLAASTAYTYRVRATNAAGDSANSATASATTLAAAASVLRINFQDATSQGYNGYLADTGAAFGSRNGQSYGWNADNSAAARNRNVAGVPDERYDTLIHMQKPENPNAFWEIAVPNGSYTVHIVSGDPGGATDAIYKVNAEGVLAINSNVAPTPGQFFENTVTVTVADGRLTISNASGSQNNKINYIDITPNAPAGLNFASGFTGATGLTLNGTTTINGGNLQLTASGANEAASAFSTSQIAVNKFTTQFDFNQGAAAADGMAFVIQNAGNTALGPSGGGLGYGSDTPGGAAGIISSLAIKFDLYNNAGEGVNSTGVFTSGASPTINGLAPTTGSNDLTGSGIDLHSGHNFRANISYDGTTLTVKLTDLTTNASATQTYLVNIPGLVGGNSAFVGFTAGTGGMTATQSILNWTFTPQ